MEKNLGRHNRDDFTESHHRVQGRIFYGSINCGLMQPFIKKGIPRFTGDAFRCLKNYG
jgi:hypothetical protein